MANKRTATGLDRLARQAPEIRELRDAMERNAEHYRERLRERRSRKGTFTEGDPSAWSAELDALLTEGIEDITIGYWRVSSESQASEMGPIVQQQQITAWCQVMAHPRLQVDLWIWDVETGTSADRQGYMFVQQAARHWQVTRIVCQKLDRFSREGGGAEVVIRQLKKLGTAVISAVESIDENYMGDLIRMIFLAIARYEAAVIQQRTRTGRLAKVKREGTYLGGPPPYGYFNGIKDGEGEGRLRINESEARVIRLAFYLRDQGYRPNAILEAFNRWKIPPRLGAKWDRIQFCKLFLRERQYRGESQFGKLAEPGSRVAHLPILPPASEARVPKPPHPYGTRIPNNIEGPPIPPPKRVVYMSGFTQHQARILATAWALYDMGARPLKKLLEAMLELNLTSLRGRSLNVCLVSRMIRSRPTCEVLVNSMGAKPFTERVPQAEHTQQRLRDAQTRAKELREIPAGRVRKGEPTPTTFAKIAEVLNREGYNTAQNRPWRSESVRIKLFCRPIYAPWGSLTGYESRNLNRPKGYNRRHKQAVEPPSDAYPVPAT